MTATSEQKMLLNSAKALGDQSLRQIGLYLDSANVARAKLAEQPTDSLAQSDYNFAVARIVEIIGKKDLEPWGTPLACPSGNEAQWTLSLTPPDPRPEYHPSNFEIFPTDRYDFKGTLVGERSVRAGLGAPVVVQGKDLDFTKFDQFAQGDRVFYGMTALIRFDGTACELVLADPLQVADATLDDNQYRLATDFQAPLALALAELNPRKSELQKMFKPGEFVDTARLARLQPYDPEKIPVLFIHGLSNSPATWAPMIDHLRNNDEIRMKYQFWSFSYPTGLPYPIPAASLRTQLDQIKERYPDHKDIVIVGHSMGGMISRLLITDSGMQLWDASFDRPPDQMGLSETTRDLFSEALIFDSRTDVSRVIYCSASHRGSDDAISRMGKLGAKLIGDPLSRPDITEEALGAVNSGSAARKRNRIPNSIDLLDPDSPFLKLVDTFPPEPGIPYHSIIGDRGKGGNLDRTEPVSSDGIVPYWSSHLDGAESEIVIPSEHWTILHQQGMDEVKRILVQHAAGL